MFCGSAAGKLLPPYVVYQATHLWSTWVDGGPERTRYNRTKSGWFDGVCFKDWFLNLFVPETRHFKDEVVLIGDNLASHFSNEVIEAAIKNKIRFVCLPTNSTHLCQPLDVAFYAPLKKQWRQILENYKNSRRKNAQNLSKENFPGLLKKLIQMSLVDDVSQNLISGFIKCGISPFDPIKVLSRIPSTSVNNDEIENNVSSAVLEVLNTLRNGNESEEPRKRKSKLNIQAGKSIQVEDLNSGHESSEPVLVTEESELEEV